MSLKLQIRLAQAFEISLLIFTLGFSYFVYQNPTRLVLAQEFGLQYAKISLGFFSLALIPGICKRLGILPVVTRTLTPIRRHLGILTFEFGLLHSLLSFYLGAIVFKSLPAFQLFTLFGTFTILTLLPPFLTSNDFSVRLLKRNWGRLQKLVHLALFFLLFHLALQGTLLSLIVAALILLEFYSYFIHPRLSKPKTATIDQTPPTNPN